MAPTHESTKAQDNSCAADLENNNQSRLEQGSEGSKKGCPEEDGGGEDFFNTWYAGGLKRKSLIKMNTSQK